MDFTREPIIETVITPREGYRLVVRNSKVMGLEEYFVDAIEMVSFGGAFFFRSIERPKPFLVPVGDYEVLEVRESRIVLKAPHAQEGSVKIGASKEMQREQQREYQRISRSQENIEEPKASSLEVRTLSEKPEASKAEGRQEKRRDRRKPFRRRRGQFRDEGRDSAAAGGYEESVQQEPGSQPGEESMLPEEVAVVGSRSAAEGVVPVIRSVLPPPTTLIRDDLQRLRDNEMYRGAFFIRDEKDGDDDDSSLESFAAEGYADHANRQDRESSDRESSKSHDGPEGVTKESSPEESFLFQKTVEEDIDRDVEDPLSR